MKTVNWRGDSAWEVFGFENLDMIRNFAGGSLPPAFGFARETNNFKTECKGCGKVIENWLKSGCTCGKNT